MGFENTEAAVQALRAAREVREADEKEAAGDAGTEGGGAPGTESESEGKPTDAGADAAAAGAAGNDSAGSPKGSTTDGGSTEPDGKTGTETDPNAGKGQGDAGAAAAGGAPAGGGSAGEVVTRVNGVDRKFNLGNDQDRADLVRAAQLGLNYERHMADLNAKVKSGVDEALPDAVDGWMAEKGLAVTGPDGQKGITIESLAKFAASLATQIDAAQGLAAFRAALDGASGDSDAPADDELSVMEKDLDPEDPAHKPTLALIKQARDLRNQLKAEREARTKEIEPLRTRLSAEDQQRQKDAAEAASKKVVEHFTAEVAKHPVLGPVTDSLKVTVGLRCRDLEKSGKAEKTPEETVAKVLKVLADEKVAERQRWKDEEKKAAADSRERPGSSPPAVTGAGGVPKPGAAPNKNGKFATESEKTGAMVDFLKSRHAGAGK